MKQYPRKLFVLAMAALAALVALPAKSVAATREPMVSDRQTGDTATP